SMIATGTTSAMYFNAQLFPVITTYAYYTLTSKKGRSVFFPISLGLSGEYPAQKPSWLVPRSSDLPGFLGRSAICMLVLTKSCARDTFVTIIIKRNATRYFQTEIFIKGILIINIRCRVTKYELHLLWFVMSHSFQNSSTNTFRKKSPISESIESFVSQVNVFCFGIELMITS